MHKVDQDVVVMYTLVKIFFKNPHTPIYYHQNPHTLKITSEHQ